MILRNDLVQFLSILFTMPTCHWQSQTLTLLIKDIMHRIQSLNLLIKDILLQFQSHKDIQFRICEYLLVQRCHR